MMIAILGGGLAGLALGRRLREKGAAFRVLEAEAQTGGLCRTIRRGAHSWDLGPHAFYSKNPAALDYYRALPLKYHELQRDVRISHLYRGGVREVSYPFENGLADLPADQRWECVWGYLRAAASRPAGGFRDLQEWIDRGLGAGIKRHFMQPYNEKIWNRPLDKISMALVSGKIEPEKPWRVVRNALVRGSVGRAYQACFLYPEEGGAGAVPEAVASSIGDSIETGWRLSRLRREASGEWVLSSLDGRELRASAVVSTIPIPTLLEALGEPALSAHAPAFASNDTLFVAVGLKDGRSFSRFDLCHWVFFAGPEIFYRISLMRSFSPNRPATLVAEVTHKGEAASLSRVELGARVLRDLLARGILGEEGDADFVDVRLERNTYPIPTLELASARRALEQSLEPRRLFLLGRNGRWDYVNTDGIFLAVDAFMKSSFERLA